MENILLGLVLGVLIAVLVVLLLRHRKVRQPSLPPISISACIDTIRAVGELVVLKVFTQQIVTRTDHLMGEWGEKWMGWLLSPKKTAMIFDFVVDFRYDLRSPQFTSKLTEDNALELNMPPCFYEIQLKDIKIYDERASALAPILLPEWIGQVFGGKFTEKEKNQLIALARIQAESMARQLAGRVMGEVQHSAEVTLRQIARAVNLPVVQFRFSDRSPVQGSIDVSSIEQSATNVITQQKP